jgi:uncharacterized protein
VMENTLEAGLARLFGGTAPPREPSGAETRGPGAAPEPPPAAPATAGGAAPAPELSALAAEARGHYDRAIQAQRQGDWATYGEELRQLGQVLGKMRSR